MASLKNSTLSFEDILLRFVDFYFDKEGCYPNAGIYTVEFILIKFTEYNQKNGKEPNSEELLNFISICEKPEFLEAEENFEVIKQEMSSIIKKEFISDKYNLFLG